MRVVTRRATVSGKDLEYKRSHVQGPTRTILKVVAQAWQGINEATSRGRRNQIPLRLLHRLTVDDGGGDGD